MNVPAFQRLRRVPVAALVVFSLAWLVSPSGLMRRMEWRTLDARSRFRVHFQPPPDPRVNIVLFEDTTEMNLTPWPPDRGVHGEMIELLTLAAPRVVTWDVILDAMREGEGDAKLARATTIAMRAGVNVITAGVSNPDPVENADAPAGPTKPIVHVEGEIKGLLGDEFAVLPFPALRSASLFGFVDTPPSSDGVRREVPLVVRIGPEVYPSLSLQTLMAFYDVPAEAVRVRLGDAVYLPTKSRGELRLPVDAAGRFFVNYRYDQDEEGADFRTWNYLGTMIRLSDAFVDRKPGAKAPEGFRGGVVFLGQTVTGKADAGPTPRSPTSPLVLIHANLVNNVLADDLAVQAPAWAVWLGAVLWGSAGIVLGLRRSLETLVAFTVLTAAVYLFAAYGAWIRFSLWLPLVWPLTGFGVLQFYVIGRRVLHEQRAREQVKQMFGTYLSPELLNKMLKEGKSVAAVSSERRPVTILFSDLRDFTSLTEKMEDQALIRQLNEYLSAMVECIHREGGTLHKFIGDAVMAVWGDLGSQGIAADATRAARAALAMQARLGELNETWRRNGLPVLRMGIGLNHGVVLIGNIGSPRRMEFTAIGDAVNLASRLEGLNKELKTEILAGESLLDLLGSEFELCGCGSVPVKGKARPVAVFELVGRKAAAPAVSN